MTEFDKGEEGTGPIIETADDAALRAIQGHAWLGNAGLTLILPSGITIGSEEAQAFSSLFGPQAVTTEEQ